MLRMYACSRLKFFSGRIESHPFMFPSLHYAVSRVEQGLRMRALAAFFLSSRKTILIASFLSRKEKNRKERYCGLYTIRACCTDRIESVLFLSTALLGRVSECL